MQGCDCPIKQSAKHTLSRERSGQQQLQSMCCDGAVGRSNTLLCCPHKFFQAFIISLPYVSSQCCIRSLADRARLDYAVPWHSQSKETVSKIIGAVSSPSLFFFLVIDHITQAHERHNFLNGYPHAWPVEEFLKTYRRKPTQRQGRHHEDEDAGHHELEKDDDEEEEEKEEEEKVAKQKQEHDQDEEQEEDEWTRGNGWGVDGFEDDYVQA